MSSWAKRQPKPQTDEAAPVKRAKPKWSHSDAIIIKSMARRGFIAASAAHTLVANHMRKDYAADKVFFKLMEMEADEAIKASYL